MSVEFINDSIQFKILALLISGHIVSDFAVQTRFVALNKGTRNRVLLWHGFMTFLVQSLFLFPFWSLKLFLFIGLLAAVHVGIDFGKRWIQRIDANHLRVFFLDQGIHILSLVAFWLFIRNPLSRLDIRFLEPGALNEIAGISVLFAGFVFNAKGGNAIVQGVLKQFPSLVSSDSVEDEQFRMGRMMGTLERFLLLTLILVNQWIALALVVGIRSMGAIRNLEWQTAGYYRLGMLASWLVAVISGIVITAFVSLQFN